MWIYSQSSGNLWDDRGLLITRGYSGGGEGLNNPKLEAVKNIGPIPRGMWVLSCLYDSKSVGPHAIVLEPSGHNALERTYFRIHGDNRHMNKTASEGCVILPRPIREKVWNSGDKLFLVIE